MAQIPAQAMDNTLINAVIHFWSGMHHHDRQLLHHGIDQPSRIAAQTAPGSRILLRSKENPPLHAFILPAIAFVITIAHFYNQKLRMKIIAKNKRAYHDYHIEEKLEAGIALSGSEVKSMRAGNFNFSDSYVRIINAECWLIGMHISPYKDAGYAPHKPEASRRLLLHKMEIIRMRKKAEQKGYTLVPLAAYLKQGLIKIEIGVGRGKSCMINASLSGKKIHAGNWKDKAKGQNLGAIMKFLPVEDQLAIIKRGTSEIIPEAELRQKLERSRQTGKPLRIKLGVDPTASDLHLGFTVVIRKLRQFQDLGHQIILIIGNYTAMVGDPSGKNKTRPRLQLAEVEAHAAQYQEQFF
jgi:SsrA-binding protein